jgi:hypothetical protein
MPPKLSESKRKRIRRQKRALRQKQDAAVADGVAAILREDQFEYGLAEGRRRFYAAWVTKLDRILRKR